MAEGSRRTGPAGITREAKNGTLSDWTVPELPSEEDILVLLSAKATGVGMGHGKHYDCLTSAGRSD